MKVSVNWLRELVNIDLSVEDLAHTLTMAGLEVEEVAPVATFEGIVVAEVKSVSTHPNADKLRVCEVDAGTGTLLQIVCGAPNVAAGMRVPCALVGAKLPGIEIKPTKLRGVDSNGMLCSARELGLSNDHGGLLALRGDASIGQDMKVYLGLSDVYLTLKMTPNRGDCLSMIGVARDLAAVTGANLRIPSIENVISNSEVARAVTISAPKACGQYLGRVLTNLNAAAETPEWMKKRLEGAGFRSIAPLVDITNYLTLERGRPMHAFDNDKLANGIDVRFARNGEKMTLLNEQDVSLTDDMLLIADSSGPVAMGGVMGGLQSMCTSTTRNVFFEAAYFDPEVIQGKTRRLGINSDAAYRFERGVDPEGARAGIEYATALAIAICGTSETKVGPVSEAIGELPQRKSVVVRPERVRSLIGMPIADEIMIDCLKRLACQVETREGVLHVKAPSYRFDMNIEEEFVEEIARIHGYEKIPAISPVSSMPMLPVPEGVRSRHAIRHAMASMGYQEVINYSFTEASWEMDFAGQSLPLKLANPIASQMSVMRSTLIGGLIASLRHNINHGEGRLKLFEIGRCFLANEPSINAQPEKLGGIVYGLRFPEQWGEGGQKGARADFFSVKGEIETLLNNENPVFSRAEHPALHPGRSAKFAINDRLVGIVGELHPRLQQKYELPLTSIVFEMDVIAASNVKHPSFAQFSRMQSVRRDISLMVDGAINIHSLCETVKAENIPSIVEFAPFDIYLGPGLDFGKKSVAFRIVMQDTDRTLTDSEADEKVARIVEVLRNKNGATLRK